MTSTGRHCKATRKNGVACASYAVEGSAFCFWHCPDKARERKEARSRGGRARHGRRLAGDHQGVKLESLADVVRLVEGAVKDVSALENSIARARCLGYLAGVAVKALQVADLEERILRLEAWSEQQ